MSDLVWSPKDKWAASWENRLFAFAKTKTQISFAVTAKLISAFVFATQIVQFLFYLNPKFQASSYILWLHSPVCVGPGRKPRRPVYSERGSNYLGITWTSPFSYSFYSRADNNSVFSALSSVLHKIMCCGYLLELPHGAAQIIIVFFLPYHQFSIKSCVVDIY